MLGPPPGTGGEKRKAEDELSENWHTKKSRNRTASLEDEELVLEQKKNAMRAAKYRVIKDLRKTQAWLDADVSTREQMEKDAEVANEQD